MTHEDRTEPSAESGKIAGHGAARRSSSWLGWTAAVVIPVALAVAGYAMTRTARFGPGLKSGDDRFQLDMAQHVDVAEKWIGYDRVAEYRVRVESPSALAVGPAGVLYIAGHNAIERLTADGKTMGVWQLDESPRSLSVPPRDHPLEGQLVVALPRRLMVLSSEGKAVRQWSTGSDRSMLTATALTADSLFVADAGQRLVLHYDLTGKLLGTIGRRDQDREMPGFVIPSPYFDLCADAEGLMVANPGARRVEFYTVEGELQSFWGQAGSDLPNFFGCCNPAHLARLDDDHLVTAEKGIPRIKVYTTSGEMVRVVAGPRQLDVPATALGDARLDDDEHVFDITVDPDGDVLALDSRKHRVLRFALRASLNSTERDETDQVPPAAPVSPARVPDRSSNVQPATATWTASWAGKETRQ